jgi:hypothetical protein
MIKYLKKMFFMKGGASMPINLDDIIQFLKLSNESKTNQSQRRVVLRSTNKIIQSNPIIQKELQDTQSALNEIITNYDYDDNDLYTKITNILKKNRSYLDFIFESLFTYTFPSLLFYNKYNAYDPIKFKENSYTKNLYCVTKFDNDPIFLKANTTVFLLDSISISSYNPKFYYNALYDILNGRIMNYITDKYIKLKPYLMSLEDVFIGYVNTNLNINDIVKPNIKNYEPAIICVSKAIEGISIGQYLKQGNINLDIFLEYLDRLWCVMQLLGSEFGFLHNDLHEENIFICKNNFVLIDYSRSTFNHKNINNTELNNQLLYDIKKIDVKNNLKPDNITAYSHLLNKINTPVRNIVSTTNDDFLFDLIAMTMNIYKHIHASIFKTITINDLFLQIIAVNKKPDFIESITFKKNYTGLNNLIDKYSICFDKINNNGEKCILEGLLYLSMLLDIISNIEQTNKCYVKKVKNKITQTETTYTLNTNTPIRMYFQVKEIQPFITDAPKYISTLIENLNNLGICQKTQLLSRSRYAQHVIKQQVQPQVQGGKRIKKKYGGVTPQSVIPQSAKSHFNTAQSVKQPSITQSDKSSYITDYSNFMNNDSKLPELEISNLSYNNMVTAYDNSDEIKHILLSGVNKTQIKPSQIQVEDKIKCAI